MPGPSDTCPLPLSCGEGAAVLVIHPAELIERKRDGGTLSTAELEELVLGYVDGHVHDEQMAAFLMAVYFRGLTPAETYALTDAMVRSGESIDLTPVGSTVVDKHSTGGVGDKTSIVLGPVVAACGVPFGKMSGRGLGHTGGTLDKLEAIPGYRVSLEPAEFVRQVRDVGLAIVGQTPGLVPADRKLYALRDVTATVDEMSLIAASIMAKKIAAGAHAILLDVKVGEGAFMRTVQDARRLATTMLELGRRAERRVACELTAMSQPLGHAVGNALEVREALATLQGSGPVDLEELVVHSAATLLTLADPVTGEEEARRPCPFRCRGRDGPRRLRALDRRAGWGSPRGSAAVGSGRSSRACSWRGIRRRHRCLADRTGSGTPRGRAGSQGRGGRPCDRDPVPREARRSCGAGPATRRGARENGRSGRGGCRRDRGVLRAPAGGSGSLAAAARDRRLTPHWRRERHQHRSGDARGRRYACRVPELPEVETISRRLGPVLVGRRLARVVILDERLTRPEPPAAVAHSLEGQRVVAVGRRGKYVVVEFESGRHLLVHLRMTGSFRAGRGESLEDDSHRRAVVSLDDGSDVVYRDVRRFGTWTFWSPGSWTSISLPGSARSRWARGSRAGRSGAVLAGRTAPVKAILLDQRRIAGVGNIYADEALWYARVDPRLPGGALSAAEVRATHRGVRRALQIGIDRQGATLRDYRDPSGAEGTMQDEFRVYGRAGLPCARCRSPIAEDENCGARHVVLSAMSTGARSMSLFLPEGVLVGNWSDDRAWTGCTVVLVPDASVVACEVQGGGPGTRESDLLTPQASAPGVNAIMLSGGSAFGLGAADGAVDFLAERGIGYRTRAGLVPLVAGAVVYDLALGDAEIRPDRGAGYLACEAACPELERGSVGAGTGCTVGKILGPPPGRRAGSGSQAVPSPVAARSPRWPW